MKTLELLHEILERLPSSANGWVTCTRSDLTRALCHHPKRPGSVTTADLDRLLPRLIAAGLACEFPRAGKPPAYVIRPVTLGEWARRHQELYEEQERLRAPNADPAAKAVFNERASRETRVLWMIGPKGREPGRFNTLKELGTEFSTVN